MTKLNGQHKSVLECYSRPIVHMRNQISLNRFGLVFGAGLSKGFGIPNWDELINKLSTDLEVRGDGVLQMVPPRASQPYKTEMLFEHYKRRCYSEVTKEQHNTRPLDYRISADWREIVRKHLYAEIKLDFKQIFDTHPYLHQYLPIIKSSHMTVTYNFDDFIEKSLLHTREKSEMDSLTFEAVTNPWTQFRRTKGVIYHPNGMIPQNPLETPSDRFIFSEASYAEQLMGIFAGEQTGLLNYFTKHTCLLIGLSLEDDTLRSVLMQGARACPGNYHYYIHYLKAGEILDNEKQQAISLANFKVYNLITIFLSDEGIRALGELIDIVNCPVDQFCDFASVYGVPVRFRFYITGPLGVGKSTAINHFRNLIVLDEWLEQRLSILAKDWNTLTPTEKETADKWIADQFQQKNTLLRNLKEGVFIMDRGPLDPLAFTPDTEWQGKASRLLSTLCPGQAPWTVEDGRVIMLHGDGKELALRMIVTQRKEYTAEKLDKMEADLRNAYGSKGVISFDTTGLTSADVVRRLAEIIHLEPYQPTCDLSNRFNAIKKEGKNAAK